MISLHIYTMQIGSYVKMSIIPLNIGWYEVLL